MTRHGGHTHGLNLGGMEINQGRTSVGAPTPQKDKPFVLKNKTKEKRDECGRSLANIRVHDNQGRPYR
jgi:hypothetical protein